MSDARKAFLIASVLCFGLGIVGIVAMTMMENQARQALPPEMQTAEAIQKYYDGAVCLGCDFARIGIAFLSFSLGTMLLLCWGIYEAVCGFRNRSNDLA